MTVSTSSLISASLRTAPFSEADMSKSRKANLFSEIKQQPTIYAQIN